MSSAVAATHHVPEFLAGFVLSTEEQAFSAANDVDFRPTERGGRDTTPITATCARGNTYPGDLVEDVVVYRRLRAHSLAGKPMSEADAALLSEFDDCLRQSPRPDANDAAAMRSFYRYNCSFMAEIVCGAFGGSFEVQDISAGGVKAVGQHSFTPGDTALLVVNRGSEKTHFPSRIAWVSGDSFGLTFAGAAVVKFA